MIQDRADRQKDNATDIVRRLRDAGYETFWVGGCVRDLLRGKSPTDYDIVTAALPEKVREIFSKTIPIGDRFGVCLVVVEGTAYEVATFRAEADYNDGRRPSRITYTTAAEDVRRRDFTINGLLMDPVTGRIVDHIEGRRDIEDGIIRAIGDPAKRFMEDHLRMLRAVRFASTLDFTIEPFTFAGIRDHAAGIRKISAERIRDELSRLLTGQAARRGMELLFQSGLLAEILPEVHILRGVIQPPAFHPEGDVWEHTLRMLSLLPRRDGVADPRLAWAALLHDVGKGVTRSEDETGTHFYGHVQQGERISFAILRRLRFSRDEMEAILALVRGHMLFMNVKKMRPNRLKRFLRVPDFGLHLELHRLDCLASHGFLDHYEFCRQKRMEFPLETLRPPRLLTGRDLIGMGFSPGPVFKEILRAVEDAQLDGRIVDTDGARDLVCRHWGCLKCQNGGT